MIKHLLITVDTDKADPLGGIPLESPAVEVVRCGECEHGFDWAYDRLLCELWADGDEDSKARLFPRVEPDGFCFLGKRREDA